MMNMDFALIQTALLALQQQGELKFNTKCGDSIKTGFWKQVTSISDHELSEIQVTIYMNKKSPTGFGIEVDAIAEIPQITIIDRHLESFEDFEEAIEGDYFVKAYKAIRGRQIARKKAGLEPCRRATH